MSKPKEIDPKAVKEEIRSLEELILNYQGGKYSAIPLAAVWAKVLKKREEHRHLTSNELLDQALREVLTGEVTWKEIQKHSVANGVSSETNGSEEKAKR